MKEHFDKLNRLSESHGALEPGKGFVSGVVALILAALCFLGVLAFHFPEYLTTPQLRKAYSVDAMRLLLFWSLVIAGAMALFNIVMGRARWLAFGAFILIGLSLAEMRAAPELATMRVLRRGNRLSITPVSDEEWRAVGKLLDAPAARA